MPKKKKQKKVREAPRATVSKQTLKKPVLDMENLHPEHKSDVKRIHKLSTEERQEEAEGMVELISDETEKLSEILKDAEAQSEYINHLSLSLLLLTGNYEEKKHE